MATALWCLGPEPADEEEQRIETFLYDDEANEKWSKPGKYLWKMYEPQSNDNEYDEKRRMGNWALLGLIVTFVSIAVTIISIVVPMLPFLN